MYVMLPMFCDVKRRGWWALDGSCDCPLCGRELVPMRGFSGRRVLRCVDPEQEQPEPAIDYAAAISSTREPDEFDMKAAMIRDILDGLGV